MAVAGTLAGMDVGEVLRQAGQAVFAQALAVGLGQPPDTPLPQLLLNATDSEEKLPILAAAASAAVTHPLVSALEVQQISERSPAGRRGPVTYTLRLPTPAAAAALRELDEPLVLKFENWAGQVVEARFTPQRHCERLPPEASKHALTCGGFTIGMAADKATLGMTVAATLQQVAAQAAPAVAATEGLTMPDRVIAAISNGQQQITLRNAADTARPPTGCAAITAEDALQFCTDGSGTPISLLPDEAVTALVRGDGGLQLTLLPADPFSAAAMVLTVAYSDGTLLEDQLLWITAARFSAGGRSPPVMPLKQAPPDERRKVQGNAALLAMASHAAQPFGAVDEATRGRLDKPPAAGGAPQPAAGGASAAAERLTKPVWKAASKAFIRSFSSPLKQQPCGIEAPLPQPVGFAAWLNDSDSDDGSDGEALEQQQHAAAAAASAGAAATDAAAAKAAADEAAASGAAAAGARAAAAAQAKAGAEAAAAEAAAAKVADAPPSKGETRRGRTGGGTPFLARLDAVVDPLRGNGASGSAAGAGGSAAGAGSGAKRPAEPGNTPGSSGARKGVRLGDEELMDVDAGADQQA
ncbi:hypothetical protein Rsub_13403 [Raphidocelis subcapitata]|uniref:Uncharacterized protein n=1 Tax=Raphidocelis subcapitata TaxID=307507 RepID=A0A2V0PPI6_9CHLO|nr:hypothetical protein Rsub_13403 [Raphidocelis subcapitata]|eukprot:GBG00084.1 hypothetical protein Rsub_13403 [Raphidocelis subcapitata]